MSYPPDYVWRMTPRQIEATLFVARKRLNRQRLEELEVAQTARTSDEKTFKNFVRRLQE